MTLSRSTGGCVNVLYKDTTLDGYTANGVLHVVIYSNGRTRIPLRAEYSALPTISSQQRKYIIKISEAVRAHYRRRRPAV